MGSPSLPSGLDLAGGSYGASVMSSVRSMRSKHQTMAAVAAAEARPSPSMWSPLGMSGACHASLAGCAFLSW
jgi:hypothetical protein